RLAGLAAGAGLGRRGRPAGGPVRVGLAAGVRAVRDAGVAGVVPAAAVGNGLRVCSRRPGFGRARLLPSRFFCGGRLGRSLALPLREQTLTPLLAWPARGAPAADW